MCETTVGGAYAHVVRLAGLLVHAGHDVTLVVGRARPHYDATPPAAPCPVVEAPLARGFHPLRDLHAVVWLFFHFRAGRYDLAHTHAAKAGLCGRLAAFLARVPVLLHTPHTLAYEHAESAPARVLYRLMEWLLAPLTTSFIAVSEVQATELARLVPRRRVACIPNGVELEVPARNPGAGAERLLLSVGRLEAQKDPVTLLRAFAQAAGRDAALRLSFAGEGSLREPLARLARELGVADKVELLGQVSDIAALLARADALVSSSRFEGMPYAVLEAMCAGVAVLASDLPAHRELLAEGALYFSPGDAAALAGLMLEPPGAARDARVTAARERVRAQYDAEHFAEATLHEYWRRLSKPPSLGAPVQLAAVDGAALIAAVLCAYALRFRSGLPVFTAVPSFFPTYVAGLGAVLPLFLGVFWALGLYERRAAPTPLLELEQLLKATFLFLLTAPALTFFLRGAEYSRGVLLLVPLFLLPLSAAGRLALRRWSFTRAVARGGSRVLVAGPAAAAKPLYEAALASPEPLDLPVGVAATEDAAEVVRQARRAWAHEVVLIGNPLPYSLVVTTAMALSDAGARLSVAESNLAPFLRESRGARNFGGATLIDIDERLHEGFWFRAKRVVDVGVAALGLVLLSPLFALTGIALRIAEGSPVLYRQERVGRHGRRFTLYKLRTMRRGAEAELGSLVDVEHLAEPVYKIPSDPRVFPLGRVLRRLGIDELPQLYNVLVGDMSLVGPRPEATALVLRYGPEHQIRLQMRPGLTGLQQVEARGSASMSERLRLDLRYLTCWSPFLDIVILLRTLWVVISGKGVP